MFEEQRVEYNICSLCKGFCLNFRDIDKKLQCLEYKTWKKKHFCCLAFLMIFTCNNNEKNLMAVAELKRVIKKKKPI